MAVNLNQPQQNPFDRYKTPPPTAPGGVFNPNPSEGSSSRSNPGSGTGYWKGGKWVDTGRSGGGGGGGGGRRNQPISPEPTTPSTETTTTSVVEEKPKTFQEIINKNINQNTAAARFTKSITQPQSTRDINIPETPRGKEWRYNSATGTYQKPSGTGWSGTAEESPPTIAEKARIDSANYRGNFFDIPVEDIISGRKTYEGNIKKYSELTKDFDDLTYEEQQKRVEELQKAGATIDEEGYITPPNEPTVKIGFGSNKKTVAVSSLDTSNPLQLYASGMAKRMGYLFPEEGFFQVNVPEKNVTVSTLSQGTIQVDPLTGKEIIWNKKEITLPAETYRIGSSGQLENVARVAPYFIPVVGQGLFYGEQAYNLGYEVKGKGLLGGAISYVKQNPIEAGIVVTMGVSKLYKKGFGKEVKVIEEQVSTGNMLKNPSATIKMSGTERIVDTGKDITKIRSFTGTGMSDLTRAGKRVVITTPAREFFGMKPIYSGNPYGEIITTKMGGRFSGAILEKTTKITKTEATVGRKKAIEFITQKYGVSELKAKEILRRVAPVEKVAYSQFSGKAIQKISKGTGKDVAGVVFDITKSKRIEANIRLPSVVDIGGGQRAIAYSRGGTPKIINLGAKLEELKTIAPKGKEVGEIGARTLYSGFGAEVDQTAQLGKQVKKFKEVAVAKKVSETKDVFGGTIERYKTGEVSKEVTYLKPKKIGSSVVNVKVINPQITKKETVDLVTGIAKVEERGVINVGGVEARTTDFVKTAERKLIVRQEVAEFISPPKIKKTPLSKTFGMEQPNIFDKVFGTITPPQVTKTLASGEKVTKKVVTEVAKVIQPTALASLTETTLSQSQSKFYGVGGISSNLNENQGALSLNRLQIKSEVKTDVGEKIDVGQIQPPISSSGSGQKNRERLDQPQVEIPAEIPKIQPPAQVTKTRQRTSPPQPPMKVPPFKFKFSSGYKPSISSSDLRLAKAYDVFIRKKGKEVKIASMLPKGLATKAGVSRNLKDISASFKLKEAGVTANKDIDFSVPANLFTSSKRDAGRIVQRRGKRLSARTEISDILSAKRSKKRRKGIWY